MFVKKDVLYSTVSFYVPQPAVAIRFSVFPKLFVFRTVFYENVSEEINEMLSLIGVLGSYAK